MRIVGIMNKRDKVYLGDGVYIQLTSCNDWLLTTENGVEVTNKIYLGPVEINNFLEYLRSQGVNLTK